MLDKDWPKNESCDSPEEAAKVFPPRSSQYIKYLKLNNNIRTEDVKK